MRRSDCPRERLDEATGVPLAFRACGVHVGMQRNRKVFVLRVDRGSVGQISTVSGNTGIPDFIGTWSDLVTIEFGIFHLQNKIWKGTPGASGISWVSVFLEMFWKAKSEASGILSCVA